MIRFLSVFFAFVMSVTAVWAQQNQPFPGRMTFDFKGDATLLGDANQDHQRGTRLYVRYDGRLTMGLLMGEPVLMVRMKYDVVGGSVTIPTLEPGGEKYETIDLDQIPSEARDKIGVYDVKMVFHFEYPGRRDIRVLEDGGAFMKAGEYSFNVPGSPSWDDVFITSMGDFTDKGREYMSRDEARAFWSQGLTLLDEEIHGAKLSLWDLHNWWSENNTIPEYKATMRAVNRVREGINVSYGYKRVLEVYFAGRDEQDMAYALANEGETDRDKFSLNWFIDKDSRFMTSMGPRENYFIKFGEARDHAARALEKLTSLPPKVRIGDNHAPYRQSVADAREILEEVARVRRDFRPEGVDPSRLPRGRQQQMSGSYEVVRRDGIRVITEQGTGRVVADYEPNYKLLVQDSFLIDTSREYDCGGGKLSVPALDPESGDVVTTFEVPCSRGFGKVETLYETSEDRDAQNPSSVMFKAFDGARQTFNPTPPKRCSGLKFMKTAETSGTGYEFDLNMNQIRIDRTIKDVEGHTAGDALCLRRSK